MHDKLSYWHHLESSRQSHQGHFRNAQICCTVDASKHVLYSARRKKFTDGNSLCNVVYLEIKWLHFISHRRLNTINIETISIFLREPSDRRSWFAWSSPFKALEIINLKVLKVPKTRCRRTLPLLICIKCQQVKI